MLKVISFKICPFVQRVTAMLEAKNVPYKVDYISLQDKPQWFLDISPTGQVPVLITESGIALFDSNAIVEYLDDIFDPIELKLTAEQRALDRAWCYQATKCYLMQCSAQRSKDLETLKERAAKLDKVFDKAEKALGNGPYFKGKDLSNVDIAWITLLHRAAIIENYSRYDFFEKYSKIKKWQKALLKEKALTNSVANDFEKAFIEFYLSNETFLGKEYRKWRAREDSNP